MAAADNLLAILTALVERPRHGHEILRAVRAMSGGRLRLSVSTLYAALDQLSEDGLVTEYRQEAVDGLLRRYYRLTYKSARRVGVDLRLMGLIANERARR